MEDVNQKISIFIQARMGSSRLPGKVLKKLGNKTILEHIVDRSLKSKYADQVVVLTSTEKQDNEIVEFCQIKNYEVFAGSESDVLDRFYKAAQSFKSTVIVRLTADCPFMDPQVIDELIKTYLVKNYDYISTRLPPPWKRTWPVGLDIEIINSAILEKVWKEAIEDYQRVHVMPYIYENQNIFSVHIVECEENIGNFCWTLDTKKDYEFLEKLNSKMDDKENLSWKYIYNIVNENEDLNWTTDKRPQKNFKKG